MPTARTGTARLAVQCDMSTSRVPERRRNTVFLAVTAVQVHRRNPTATAVLVRSRNLTATAVLVHRRSQGVMNDALNTEVMGAADVYRRCILDSDVPVACAGYALESRDPSRQAWVVEQHIPVPSAVFTWLEGFRVYVAQLKVQ